MLYFIYLLLPFGFIHIGKKEIQQTKRKLLLNEYIQTYISKELRYIHTGIVAAFHRNPILIEFCDKVSFAFAIFTFYVPCVTCDTFIFVFFVVVVVVWYTHGFGSNCVRSFRIFGCYCCAHWILLCVNIYFFGFFPSNMSIVMVFSILILPTHNLLYSNNYI